MAFPQVRSSATYVNDTAQNVHSITLPASIAAGDLLVVVFPSFSISANVTLTAGWSAVTHASGLTYFIAYKTAVGDETVLTYDNTGNTARRMVARSYAISGVASGFEHVWGASDSFVVPDITTAFASGTDVLWLAAAYAQTTIEEITAAPVNFTNFTLGKNTASSATDRVQVASARYTERSSSLSSIGSFSASGALSSPQTVILAIPGTSTRYGFRITGIKEPNVTDTLVTGVSTATVMYWPGGDESVAPQAPIANQSITGGIMEVEPPGADTNDTPVVHSWWSAGGGETKFFRATPTIIDLDA